MYLTEAEVDACERELCRRSLAEFAKRAWPVLEPAAPLKWGWALDAICEHLEAVTDGRITRLLMNVPPGPMRHDSIVETERGQIALRDVVIGDRVLTHRGRYRDVSAVHDQGVLPILRITTHSGRVTHAAPTHPYLTPRGWVEAGELKAGDILAVVCPEEERAGSSGITAEASRFLGYLVGDGSVTQAAPVFVNGERDVIDDFIACAHALGFHVSEVRRKSHWCVRVLGGHVVRDWLESHGLQGKNSYTKRIPEAVRNGSTEAMRNFIGAYWTCDGGFDVRKTGARGSKFRAYGTTVSRELADDLVQVLGLLGIESRLRVKSRKLETAAQPGGQYRSFSVEVQNESMTARFAGMPGLCARKDALARQCEAEFQQVLWNDPIIEIVECEPAWCLCLTVEDDHSFTCSGIAVKNSMKSLLTGVIWPAWEWGPKNMPEMRFVGTAHEETLAIRDSRRCRDLIKSEWFQKLWPLELSSDLDGKREFGNVRKGIRQARSFTSMTGVRGDRIILDDPISADSANSPAKLEAAKIAFTETLPTRVNSDKSAIVVIMQRLNEKDVSGVILEMGLPYVHLCIPMRYEPGHRCSTSIGWTDPRTEEGELMFPERFGEQQVKELEKTLGSYGAAGQLQQRPAPRGGGILKEAWFRYYSVCPKLDFRTIHVDTAQKTAQANDYSVFQCWGRSAVGEAVLIDQIRGKWEAPELLVQARAFWLKHIGASPAPLRSMQVEDKVSGTGLIQTLRREGIPIIPVQRNNDKISRAHDAAPFIESGNVLLPIDAPWLSDLLSEASAFPGGAHDDQLDPMFDAIRMVQVAPAMGKAQTTIPMPVANHWRR